MTRQHFNALAAALAQSRPDSDDTQTQGRLLEQWANDVYVIANACARFNPNFDRSRFVEACKA
jgi:hypothetical protein